MSVLKKLASETALYGLSSIVGRFINYLLVPLHTYIFGKPSDLSPTVDLFAYVGILNVVYTFGLETGFFRFASKTGEIKKYYNLTLTAVVMISFVLSLSIVMCAPLIGNFLNYPGKLHIIVWLAVIMFVDAVMAIPFARLRLEKKAKRFVYVKIVNILLTVFLNAFFLVFCKGIYDGLFLNDYKQLISNIYRPDWSVEYIFIANLIANASFFWLLRKQLIDFKLQFDKSLFLEIWHYSLPIMVLSLMGMVNLMADRVFLRNFLPEGFYKGLSSEDALSIYGQCYKLSMLMNLAVQSFKFAADPFFFSNAEDKNAPHLLALVMKWFVIVCVVLWLLVSLNNDLIGVLFLRTAIYRQGLYIVPILSLAYLFLGVYYNQAFWFKLTDKTNYGIWISAIGALATIVLNIVLVPKIGYLGCAWAFLISTVVMCCLCYWLGQKHYPVPYKLVSALGYIGSAALLIYLASFVKISNLWFAVPYHLVLCILFILGIVLTERNSLPHRLKQKLQFLK